MWDAVSFLCVLLRLSAICRCTVASTSYLGCGISIEFALCNFFSNLQAFLEHFMFDFHN